MTQRVAVIGAGLAGAACARRLAGAGWLVEVFEKSRAAGGRLTSQHAKTPLGELIFDHGAQYVTVRSEAFADRMRAWMVDGATQTWEARLVNLDDRGLSRPISALAWVGKPGMESIVEAELDGQIVWYGSEIVAVRGTPRSWRLEDGRGEEHGPYDAIVLAIPAEPAANLLGSIAPLLAVTARGARVSPCWAASLAFDAPVEVGFDGAQIARGSIAWAARNSSKPGRGPLENGAETWVVHAAPGWSRQHLDLSPEEAAPQLVEAFRHRVRAPEPVWSSAYCWAHAQVERAAGGPFLWDPTLKVGACGDWLQGPRAELAWRSGDELAEVIGVSR